MYSWAYDVYLHNSGSVKSIFLENAGVTNELKRKLKVLSRFSPFFLDHTRMFEEMSEEGFLSLAISTIIENSIFTASVFSFLILIFNKIYN